MKNILNKIKLLFNRTTDNGITYNELRNIISKNNNIYIIDVRSSQEFKEGYLQNAINIPLYDLKKNICKSNIKFLKNCTLRDILSNQISGKYKKVNKDENENILQTIINCPILKKILSEKYMYLSDIYLKSQRIINLDAYGLNKTIELPKKIELFDDLLKKYTKEENNEYLIRLKSCIQKYFY